MDFTTSRAHCSVRFRQNRAYRCQSHHKRHRLQRRFHEPAPAFFQPVVRRSLSALEAIDRMAGREWFLWRRNARSHLSQGALAVPRRFSPEQPTQSIGRRQRSIQHGAEFGERAGVERKERLVQQHVLRLAAGRLQHEIRPATAESLGCLIDQIALPHLGANVDGHGFSRARVSHGEFLIRIFYTSMCVRLQYGGRCGEHYRCSLAPTSSTSA